MKRIVALLLLPVAALALAGLAHSEDRKPADAGKIRVVIIDGQNNHAWQATTPILKKELESCGRFTVEVATSPARPKAPTKPKDEKDEKAQEKYKDDLAKFKDADASYKLAMAKFHPDLTKFDVVLSNYNGDTWSPEFQKDLDEAVKAGKIGLVIVHAANNSFGGWKEYNQMIGMGWRGTGGGDRLYLDESGKEVRVKSGEGDGSGHRYTGEFTVTVRDGEHPITRGMPREWMHARDELYDNMRGPIQHIHLLATAYSKGTKVHEPMIWTIDYGKGRVFHTPMGHDVNAMKCIGFIGTLQRGTEWAATGKVTLPLPEKFPTAEKSSSISDK
jgi:type 1 glutamine amidotransferase